MAVVYYNLNERYDMNVNKKKKRDSYMPCIAMALNQQVPKSSECFADAALMTMGPTIQYIFVALCRRIKLIDCGWQTIYL